jgi:hypothetical protein
VCNSFLPVALIVECTFLPAFCDNRCNIRGLLILEITQEFFTSPMWVDTIKDFVLANCFIFVGEKEFSHAHQQWHRRFCQVIEDTLRVSLLDIIRIPFTVFHGASLAAARAAREVAASSSRRPTSGTSPRRRTPTA